MGDARCAFNHRPQTLSEPGISRGGRWVNPPLSTPNLRNKCPGRGGTYRPDPWKLSLDYTDKALAGETLVGSEW
jgi:hypothetical protein